MCLFRFFLANAYCTLDTAKSIIINKMAHRITS